MPKVTDDYLAARRQHILDRSREVFAVNGFHATSMQDLLAASGMSAGAFYRYFDSKTAVITAIAEQAAGDLVAAVTEAAARDGATIGDMMAAVVTAMGRRGDIDTVAPLIVQAWGEAVRDPAFGDHMRAGMGNSRALMTRVIRRNQRAGLLPSGVKAEDLLAVFFALIPGYLLQCAVFGADSMGEMPKAIRALWANTNQPSRTR